MNDLELQNLIKDLISQKQSLEEELTRRNALEDELATTNEYLQTLHKNALDITIVLNEDKLINYINGPVQQIFGVEPSDMLGTNISEIISSEEREDFEKKIDELLKEEAAIHTTQLTIPQSKSSGDKKIMECICRRIKGIDRDINILINSRDVTDRANVQRILNGSLNQLLTAQKIAKIGSWEWEVDKDYFNWSKELSRIFGNKTEHHSSTLDEFLSYLHTDSKMKFKTALDKAVETSGTFDVEVNIETTEGEARLLHLKGEIFQDEDQKKKVIATGQDITSLKEAEHQLREYSEQLRHFNAKQDMIIENERNQIAREIHDDLGQMLTVLKMDVFLLKEKVKMELDEEKTGEFRDEMRSIFSRFDTLINSVQQITHNLRPEVISDLGLIEAIKWLCKDFGAQNKIQCTFIDNSGDLGDMILEYKNAFFRIVQQALNNVKEHADATKVTVELNYNNEFLSLNIRDNGKGIKDDKARHPNSLGLLSMRERSHYLGGDFSINGLPGKGTEVSLKIPVDEILFKY